MTCHFVTNPSRIFCFAFMEEGLGSVASVISFPLTLTSQTLPSVWVAFGDVTLQSQSPQWVDGSVGCCHHPCPLHMNAALDGEEQSCVCPVLKEKELGFQCVTIAVVLFFRCNVHTCPPNNIIYQHNVNREQKSVVTGSHFSL